MLSTFKIARMGEELVYKLLPNAKWMNPLTEQRDHYDIEWKGIKIDVKTAGESRKTGQGYIFSTGGQGIEGVVLVLVGLTKHKPYFWITRRRSSSVYARFADVINEHDLPQAILNELK